MENYLRELLTELVKIGEQHEEVYDTDVRDSMREAVFSGLLKPAADFSMPSSFKMFSEAGNQLVKAALAKYISAARAEAEDRGLDFHERLSSFQNENVVGPDQTTFDEFFSYVPAEEYDADGRYVGG